MNKKYDVTDLMNLIKNLGVVVGGFGSLAVLFFWIGNTIIVARLRAYKLYGIVHYTDEYIKEAGFQFLQDIFTFFQRWDLVVVFILAVLFLFLLIPLGPFMRKEQQPAFLMQEITKKPYVLISRFRALGIHYLLFLLLTISVGISLTAQWKVKAITNQIMRQEQMLADVVPLLKDKLLVFIPKEKVQASIIEKRFMTDMTSITKDINTLVMKGLTAYYQNIGLPSEEIQRQRDALMMTNMRARALLEFQLKHDIKEGRDVLSNNMFGTSETRRVLLNNYLSRTVQEKLSDAVGATLKDIRELLSGHLRSDEDSSSLVVIPANYEVVNTTIQKLLLLRELVDTFFIEENDIAKIVMRSLAEVEPLHFGTVLLSYSFWVLIGILIYLLANVTGLMSFRPWEQGYYALMFFLFLTIAIALPTAYGRYKFEFSILKLNDIVFTGSGTGQKTDAIETKLRELWKKGTKLYLLGPTRGKEVIVGAVSGGSFGRFGSPQIIVLDRETYNYMRVEPVPIEHIPELISMLRERRTAEVVRQ